MPGDQTATQLPFMEGSRAARFSKHSVEKTVGGAHTIAIMTRDQAAERPSDGVVPVLLRRPQRIKAMKRVVFSSANCILWWFGKCNIVDAFLRVLQCCGVVGFQEDDALSIAQNEPGTPLSSLPFNTIGTFFCNGSLMRDLAFLQPGT